MGLLDGKVVFITGGGRGQGRAHALASAQEGADVILTDIDAPIRTVPYGLAGKEDLAETVRLVEDLGRRALPVVADVRSQQALDDAVAQGIAEFGKIDCLIANAGILTEGKVWELDDETWQDMIDVNLTGVWRSVKAVLPHMIERKSGSIVITASSNSDDPDPGIAHYTAAKAGVIGLMKNVAVEVAPFGIRCNAIKPGFIASEMTSWQGMLDRYAGHEGGTVEHMHQAGYYFNALPMPMMQPESTARVALFLNSDLAAYVTGQHFFVDAGHSVLSRTNLGAVIPSIED
ncbi:mycofactocin-coupled SDR family oxidoreductase [[Actinomadura] parvosata]|uniref:mycofactocin-coupled SDR family oxidoreductase n=1 Tax=[Actinomadura] parvosata TaxID=1955412 RepID=UPI00406BE674